MVQPLERILLIRPSALGDVCRSVPVLASLRAAHPQAQIDWLVRDDFAPAIAHHPALRSVVHFPRRRFARLWQPTIALEVMQFLRSLRLARYDLVVDCQGLARSGFFALSTRASRRVGFADARELGGLGVNMRVRVPQHMHTVDRMLALVEAIGVEPVRDMRLVTPPESKARLDERLRGSRFMVVAPTSRWPGKRWPAERFADLVREALSSGAVDCVAVVGAPGERAQCQPVIDIASHDERVIDLLGATNVGDLLAVIEVSAIVVANDSAALHIAVGFDKPLVGLFGPTDVALVGPYQRAQDVLQKVSPGEVFNHKDERLGAKMMSRITTSQVWQAALDRLAATTQPTVRPAHTTDDSCTNGVTTIRAGS